ncbi:hypothetical protein F4801DRAFT_238539 [Xylaria longipes]|nr:hypothetical protein F4801DRAFT_238539 [Xylaria longipes]
MTPVLRKACWIWGSSVLSITKRTTTLKLGLARLSLLLRLGSGSAQPVISQVTVELHRGHLCIIILCREKRSSKRLYIPSRFNLTVNYVVRCYIYIYTYNRTRSCLMTQHIIAVVSLHSASSKHVSVRTHVSLYHVLKHLLCRYTSSHRSRIPRAHTGKNPVRKDL